MTDYIRKDAFAKYIKKQFCENCDRRKGMKHGKLRVLYEIGDAPCRSCGIDDVMSELEYFPTSNVSENLDGTEIHGIFYDEWNGES